MAAAGSGGSGRGTWLTAALLTPTAIWFLVMLILPLIVVVIFSFGERSPVGGYGAGFTFAQYANLPSRLKAFQNTMSYAPLGTLISLLVAYYLAVKVDRKWRLLLLVLVIVPFWTSLLIRTYAWIFILGGRGIPTLLDFIGNAMVDLFLQSRNWPFGSAVAVTLVIIMLITVSLYMRFVMRDKSGRDTTIM